jgi:hypothetical protein
MQIDMHFYGVYALARAAGIKSESARIIAHSSQFVDDAIHDEPISLQEQCAAIIPIMSSHKPLDLKDNSCSEDQWRVWVCFHFLPGNDAQANSLEGKLVCQKDSELAQALLKNALIYKKELFGAHLAGVTAHVYADTFAHHGFIGITSDWNRVKEKSIKTTIQSKDMLDYVWGKFRAFQENLATSVAGTILPLGHAAVSTFPDRPYLEWQYDYETTSRRTVKRQNLWDFMEAAEMLLAFFTNFIADNPQHAGSAPCAWGVISAKIQDVLQVEASLENRVNSWKKLIASNELFTADDLDQKINYFEDEWSPTNFAETVRNPSEIDFSLWIRAARIHQQFVLNEVLPRNGILI